MLDIKFVRENPDAVREDLRKRNDQEKLSWVDDMLEKDKEYRRLLQESEELRHRRNVITDDINELKKQGKDISKRIQEAKELPKKIADMERTIDELRAKIRNFFRSSLVLFFL